MAALPAALLIILALLLVITTAEDADINKLDAFTDFKRYARYVMVKTGQAELLEWRISGWTVDNGGEAEDKRWTFEYRIADAVAERTAAATEFVRKHGLSGGDGCSDAACVVHRLVSRMEDDEGFRWRKLHTVGDSHSKSHLSFWGDVKMPSLWSFQEHPLGAITAYRYGRDPSVVSLYEFHLRPGDAVVFCFGEIDARVHIHRHSNATYAVAKDMISTLAAKYVASIEAALSTLPPTTKRESLGGVVVLGIPPAVDVPDGTNVTTRCQNLVFGSIDESKCKSAHIPFVGPPEARRSYVELFNDALIAETTRHGFHFLSLARYANERTGYLDPRYMNKKTPELQGRDNHVGSAEFVQGQLEDFLSWSRVDSVRDVDVSAAGSPALRYTEGPNDEWGKISQLVSEEAVFGGDVG